ncbi:hypothetical protein D6D24_06402 [Aureobasidium pullulans]|uniref:BTB domain-containing protein n=1 Tax=Aureobasidium pullulans TaxID=5580 RepID=A0A4V6T998_AURPU|nr:hypothetical protein D6D24_06402 [Aureobasidium pullulans]THW30704.1 hypothetical protein D6D22_10632 [Aureobasidium pullulans]
MSSDPSLAVPVGTGRPGASRTSSSKSVQRSVERIDDRQDLGTIVKRGVSPAPDSLAEVGAGSAADERPTSINIPVTKASSTGDLRSGLASPVIPDGAVQALVANIHADNPGSKTPKPEEIPTSILYAGATHKEFKGVPNYLLIKKVPYFKKLLSKTTTPDAKDLTFDGFNEFAFALFVHWLYSGKLQGPHDFHSVQHYLCLYAMGQEWDVETLCNDSIDLVRSYYHINNMTAPTFRIEYMYAATKSPNYMRKFLAETAAFRALCGEAAAKGVYLSDSMKDLLQKGGDFPTDFAQSLIKLAKEDFPDPRKGSKCDWHEHADGLRCAKDDVEPYMTS